MMRRLILLVVSGALLVALAATAVSAQQNTATLSFEVVTEGEVPQGTTFRAVGGPADTPSEPSSIELTDPDGDGTYTGSVDLTTGEYRVLINRHTGPGPEGTTTIWGPEIITLTEDTTISTRVSFGSEPGELGRPSPDEVLTGTAESEVLFGTDANDLIEGFFGHDYLNGLWGHDVIYGGAAGKPMEGDDLIVGEGGSDRIEGGPGNDFLIAAYGYWQAAADAPASPDLLRGGEGDDLIDSADKAGAPDSVECGEGDNDVVHAGVEDFVADDCETIFRYFGF